MNNNKEKYLLLLEIPTIKLSKEVYPINSKLNNVDKNIEILSQSKINKNFLILASHSGTSRNAYFNNLEKLSNDDLIYIYYKNNKYIYQIKTIYYIDKTGYLKIKDDLKNTLILITCSTKFHKKQLIISSELINIIKI